jgi:hypothetical protein
MVFAGVNVHHLKFHIFLNISSTICLSRFGIFFLYEVCFYVVFWQLRVECTLVCNLQSRARTHALLVITGAWGMDFFSSSPLFSSNYLTH